MKILHINCNYMTTALHKTMIEHLDKYTENTVFCPLLKGREVSVVPGDSVYVSECFNVLDRVFYFAKQKKIIASVKSSIDVGSFDCIHAYTLMTDGNCAMQLSKAYGIPYVVAIRDTDVNDFFKYKPYLIPLGIKIMENASAVFFLSDSYKKLMLEKFIPESKKDAISKKMHIVPNGIDDFWLNNVFNGRDITATIERLKRKELNVVCVGQIIRRKNIPVLQEALKLLEKEGWKVHLDVVGKKVDSEEYKKIISHKNTDYHEPVPKEQLIDYYRKNDIFVLPSRAETFGLVYAEAMTQGLPVLYTKGQGFDGQFEEGTVGFHVNAELSENIALNIEKLCDKYCVISENCTMVAEKFRWDDICQEYSKIYSEINAKKGECE